MTWLTLGSGLSRKAPVQQAATPPPPISGGTLIISSDARQAVVSDPGRDSVFVADLELLERSAAIKLEPGDEPGRLVQDRLDRVHIVLRGGGALVGIDPVQGAVVERRAVCDHPRGLAYDSKTDLLHVACAEGVLVSLPAAGGPPTRSVHVAPTCATWS